MCRACNAAYMRMYRATVKSRSIRQAKKGGADDFQILVISTFELRADVEFNGRAVAEIVRLLRLD